MKFFLAVSLTLLMAVGGASNHPDLNTGLSKNHSREKITVTVPPVKIKAKPRAIPKNYQKQLPPSAPRSPTKKILLPTIANGKDGLPESQADIERLVAAWFISQYDDQPSISQIREHVVVWCEGILRKTGK